MTCSLENLVSISFYASEHIIFLWICPLFRQNPQKKWRNSHNYHVIIFYIIYVDNLIENIFRAVSFFTFRTIEKLFFVLSYFRFYEMNFFYRNLMPWDAFIPKFSAFFRETRKHFQSGNFPRTCQAEIFLRVSQKNAEYLSINASHGIKFQWKKFI